MAAGHLKGDVRNYLGALMPGVTMFISGGTSGTLTTDGLGHYDFPITVAGPFTVTPSLGGHVFSPTSQTTPFSSSPTILSDFNEVSALDTGSSNITTIIGVTFNNGMTVVVTWGPSLSDDVRTYVVDAAQETSQGSGIENSYNQVAVVFAPTTSVRITGLESTISSGKRYRFRVKSVDSGNNSSSYVYSSWISVIDDATAPAQPTGLTGAAVLDDDGHTLTAVVNLAWDRNSERDLCNYVITWISPDGGVTSLPVPNYATTYRVAGLKVAKTYNFTIVALDFAQNRSQASSTFTITTPGVTTVNAAAGAPTLVSVGVAYPTSNRATTTCNIQAGTGITTAGHYSIFRSDTAGVEGTQVGTVPVGASTAAGTAATFSEGMARPYSDADTIDLYYTVRFVDNNGVVSPASVQRLVTITGTYNDNIGDPRCPTLDMYLSETLRVRDSKVGDKVIGLEDGARLVEYSILDIKYSIQPCVRLTAANGAITEVSRSTPVTLSDGTSVLAGELLGYEVATLVDGALGWNHCYTVEDIGEQEVAYIYLGKKTYATGKDPEKMIFTHNLYLK